VCAGIPLQIGPTYDVSQIRASVEQRDPKTAEHVLSLICSFDTVRRVRVKSRARQKPGWRRVASLIESRTAIGMCLAFIAIAYAAAMVFFGFFTRTSDK
jgi:hypothetical protein